MVPGGLMTAFDAHLNGKYYHHGDVQYGTGIQWTILKGKGCTITP